MKPVTPATGGFSGPLPRRDLVAIFAYVNCNGPRVKCVDGSLDAQLERLAAAARMQ